MLLKSLASAFLMYSRIPMPQVAWKEENRRYTLCFFPLVGCVIGGMLVLWRWVCVWLGFGQLLFAGGAAALPLLVTGGIHLDGLADVTDAKAACADRSKRLEILSDPHIGAFAAMYVCLYLIVQTALFSELTDLQTVALTACGFVLSRILSGLTAVTFRCAKKDGTLQSFVRPAHKRNSILALLCMLVLMIAVMLWLQPLSGGCALLAAGGVLLYYKHSAYRDFGGITGDTAGWFLQLCEIWMLGAIVFSQKLEVLV